MKGGIFTLSEHLMKMLNTAFLSVVLLAVFFAIEQYNLIYVENKIDRETLVVGDTILSADCIVEVYNNYTIKALFSEQKILLENTKNPRTMTNVTCLNYGKPILIRIYSGFTLLYEIGNHTASKTSTVFPGALKRATEIIPVTVNVTLGG
jgi:hypothetical protein